MKKIVLLVILLCAFLFTWGYAQDPTIIVPPEPSIEGDDDIILPGASYCAARWAGLGPEHASQCLSCYTNGAVYDGSSCIMIDQLCFDAFENDPEGQSECGESYNECTTSGGSPDRCSCRAVGGISLNTNVPFVGNCISMRRTSNPNDSEVTPDTAFPLLIVAVTKIMMTVILIFCFLAIIVGGVMMSMGGADEGQYNKGKDLIKHVVIALALLGASGVILRIINPSFFT